jgi:hypothetical protein
MDHPSHEKAPQHSGESAHRSSYNKDRDTETGLVDTPLPPAPIVAPPKRGGGDGDDEQ